MTDEIDKILDAMQGEIYVAMIFRRPFHKLKFEVVVDTIRKNDKGLRSIVDERVFYAHDLNQAISIARDLGCSRITDCTTEGAKWPVRT